MYLDGLLSYGNVVRVLYNEPISNDITTVFPKHISVCGLPCSDITGQEKIEIHDLLIATLLNACICYLKLEDANNMLYCAQQVNRGVERASTPSLVWRFWRILKNISFDGWLCPCYVLLQLVIFVRRYCWMVIMAKLYFVVGKRMYD